MPIPPWPTFEPDEVEAARRVLESGKVNYWTGGEGKAFEQEFAAWHGRRHGVAMANGTLTLEAALYALGVGPGDEVVVPARTFLATASAVVMRGARPVVADVDMESGNLTAETVRACLTPRTKAIIPVHLGGWPCEMDALMGLAADGGLQVVEDCAQAHGARYRGRPVGALGHIGSFSFCQDKIVTTGGEGGMLVMDDEAWWKACWSIKDHGKDWDAVNAQHPPGFRWLHARFGSNGRLTEMQAAIGRLQLGKLEAWVAARGRNAAGLAKALAGHSALRVPLPPPHLRHAWYKFYAIVEPDGLRPGWDRDRIMAELNAAGVPATVGSCPEIYRERAFTDAGLGPKGRLPVAKDLGERSLMLQVHPTLEGEPIRWMAATVAEVAARASRR